MDRRDFLIAGACAAALGGAQALKPRRMVNLLDGPELDPVIPRKFGRWTTDFDTEIVAPKVPGSLEDKLYSEIVSHTFRDTAGKLPSVMLLIAYGRSQSDLLQLHRPESCYPAVGFSISNRKLIDMSLPKGQNLPAVEMTATAGDRVEDIVYWSRLGEFFPQTAGQQRRDRLKAAMQGYVGDGALVRASTLRGADNNTPYFPALQSFFGDLVQGMPNAQRKVLIGTDRAKALA
ncbi:exosortase-associated protein EpsI, V-type [Novosphingobium umbonatum]|nr:exosortase-associated protein EpsI, V-type [Novosphingobium umbonatum]